MLNAISDFLLRDHALTQVILYSIPIVNVTVRFFHSIHSLDDFKNNDFPSADDINQFEAKKARFQTYLTTAVQIQTALAITGFVLGILFPAYMQVTALMCTSFAMGALSSFVYDRVLRSEITVPKKLIIGHGRQIDIVGY